MNYLFIKDFESRIEDAGYCIDRISQKDLMDLMSGDKDLADNFPMICYEHTDDSVFESTIHDSTFINDKIHDGDWFIIGNEDEVFCILNLQQRGSILIIDTIEVSIEHRGKGIASDIIYVIESVAEDYYGAIEVSPFDTSAINFWENMDYVEQNNGTWRLTL